MPWTRQSHLESVCPDEMCYVYEMYPWSVYCCAARLDCSNCSGTCVYAWLRFAVGVGLSGVCIFHDLIVMFVLVLNCEVL